MGVDYNAIGRRMKARRKEIGKTQDHLAEALCVTVGYISQLERGLTKISLDTLSQIAAALDCDMQKLLDGVSRQDKHYLDDELGLEILQLSDQQRALLLEIVKDLARFSF